MSWASLAYMSMPAVYSRLLPALHLYFSGPLSWDQRTMIFFFKIRERYFFKMSFSAIGKLFFYDEKITDSKCKITKQR